MMVKKIYVRGLVVAIAALAIAMLSGRTSGAAQITCLDKYPSNLVLDTPNMKEHLP